MYDISDSALATATGGCQQQEQTPCHQRKHKKHHNGCGNGYGYGSNTLGQSNILVAPQVNVLLWSDNSGYVGGVSGTQGNTGTQSA